MSHCRSAAESAAIAKAEGLLGEDDVCEGDHGVERLRPNNYRVIVDCENKGLLTFAVTTENFSVGGFRGCRVKRVKKLN